MNEKTTFTIDKKALQLVTECIIDAPRELVYKAFTDPNLIVVWWGTSQIITTLKKMDLRVGGELRFKQTDKNGNEFVYGNFFRYKEIIPNEKISCANISEGNSKYDLPKYDWRDSLKEVEETVTFEDLEGGTKLKWVTQLIYPEDVEVESSSMMEIFMREITARLRKVVEKK